MSSLGARSSAASAGSRANNTNTVWAVWGDSDERQLAHAPANKLTRMIKMLD